MDESTLEKFKQLLLSQRKKVLEDIKYKEEEIHSTPKDMSGNLSSYSQHMAETASDSYEVEKTIGLLSRETDLLYEIDEALYRIGNRTFGTCEVCKKEIPIKRLEAIPYTRVCIECGQKRKYSR